MTTPIEGITDRDFTASISHADAELVLKLTGTADVKVVEPLAAMLPRLHAYTNTHKVPRVVVDFTELDFMNSSCFKALVSWIGSLQSATDKYAIEFKSNGAPWQRRSLQALTCFAPDLITVTGAMRQPTLIG